MPAPHGVHVCPSGPDQPALQVQFVILMLALGESEFVGHPMHSVAPVKTLYFPASHGAHVPPSAPEYPALHLQAVCATLPVGALAFAGHMEHVETDVAPNVAEYFCASQSLHGTAPGESLYFPGKQTVQVCPLGPG
jgi:hypothetical protein